jgi:hypothetical protein
MAPTRLSRRRLARVPWRKSTKHIAVQKLACALIPLSCVMAFPFSLHITSCMTVMKLLRASKRVVGGTTEWIPRNVL